MGTTQVKDGSSDNQLVVNSDGSINIAGGVVPSGGATSANQVLEIAQLTSIDGKVPDLGQAVMAASAPVVIASDQSAVPVSVASLPLPAGASTAADQATGNTSLASIDGKLGQLGQNTMGGSAPVVIASNQSAVAVSAATLPLPTGASTAVLQDTGNTSLASIDTKTPALGQALAAVSVPVVLTVSQLATLTPLTIIAATQSGTWNITNVSGTISLPTGASTSTLQGTGNTSVASIDTKTPALGQALMAASTPVVIASDQTALPVSAGSLPLPSGAATSSLQTTGNTSLASIDGKLGSLGQKAMTGSAPVVIASDQSAVPSSQSGTWNITNVSGTVSLPTGASTSSLQTTGNTSLASIDGKLGSLGQKAMTGSAPVVIASDQSAVAVSAASLPLPSGAATQTTLASIDTKTPALGQALAAAAVPVVLTAIQLTTLTPLTSVAATQSGTWNITNVSGTVSLPTGASTSSLQTTGNTSLSSMDGKLGSLGQKAMTGSAPVVIASDQSAVSTAPSTPAAVSITQAGLSVGLTAVRLTVSGSAPSASRQLLVATPNITGAKFYVGSSAVTTSTGVTILGGQSFIANNDACDYYVISDTASQTVFVMEH